MPPTPEAELSSEPPPDELRAAYRYRQLVYPDDPRSRLSFDDWLCGKARLEGGCAATRNACRFSRGRQRRPRSSGSSWSSPYAQSGRVEGLAHRVAVRLVGRQ